MGLLCACLCPCHSATCSLVCLQGLAVDPAAPQPRPRRARPPRVWCSASWASAPLWTRQHSLSSDAVTLGWRSGESVSLVVSVGVAGRHLTPPRFPLSTTAVGALGEAQALRAFLGLVAAVLSELPVPALAQLCVSPLRTRLCAGVTPLPREAQAPCSVPRWPLTSVLLS